MPGKIASHMGTPKVCPSQDGGAFQGRFPESSVGVTQEVNSRAAPSRQSAISVKRRQKWFGKQRMVAHKMKSAFISRNWKVRTAAKPRREIIMEMENRAFIMAPLGTRQILDSH